MNPHEILCMIVDDEPLAIRVLEAHLGKVPDIQIVATSQSAIEARRILQQQDVDLIFLDIQMPELNGIELINSLDDLPGIIFTTAHRDYALEGFELDAIDYLLKPISLPRLLRSIDKYHRTLAAQASSTSTAHEAPPFITVRSNRMTVRIPIQDILYIESLSDYVQIHTVTGVYVCKERISHLSEKLAPEGFLRIHRSFLVAASRISSFTSELVRIDNQELPISRSYRQEVRRSLEE